MSNVDKPRDDSLDEALRKLGAKMKAAGLTFKQPKPDDVTKTKKLKKEPELVGEVELIHATDHKI